LSFFNELKRRNVLRVAAAYVVAAWLLIQVTETIFPLFGFDDGPARIVVIVLAIGLIPALIFAWAFEMTPEGLRKEKDVDRTHSITPHTGKKLDRMIMVALALALGYFAVDKFVLDPQRESALEEQKVAEVEQALRQGRTEGRIESYGDKSIAVLAFEDMSQAGDQEYLSDGIAEELLNLLAKIPDLRVISRSSAFSFKGQNLELTEIADRLNVAHILEGSVRKAGNRVRITAQLIEARSDTHLWSETYDRQLDDIFAIQDEIAAMVVEQLKITLLGEAPHVRETDPEAYALYLQALHLRGLGTAEGPEQAVALYQQALAIDPDYAAAWADLAIAYINQWALGLLPYDEGYAKSREAVEKALAIDPESARAHAILGGIAMAFDFDLAQAARHLERALQLDPSDPGIIRSAAVLLGNIGRLDEAIELEEYAAIRDPLNPISHVGLAVSYLYAGRWDDAIASFQTVLHLSPDSIGPHYFIAIALLYKGEAEAALGAMQLEPFEGARLAGLVMVHHALGDQAASDAVLNELIDKYAQVAASTLPQSLLTVMKPTEPSSGWKRQQTTAIPA